MWANYRATTRIAVIYKEEHFYGKYKKIFVLILIY